MNKKIIPCQVRDQYILGAGVVVGAAGSGADAVLRLEFGTMWDGLVKYVTFRNALGEEPVVCLLTTDMIQQLEEEPSAPAYRIVYDVTIPAKAKAIPGQMGVTVHGYEVNEDGSQVEAAAMTAQARFRVLPSGWAMPEDEGFSAPTVAQQLQAQIEAIRQDITDAAQAANAKEAARQSATQATESMNAAKGSALSAAQSAQLAQIDRAAVEVAKTAALSHRNDALNALSAAQTAQAGAEEALSGAQAAWMGAQTAQGAAETAQTGAEAAYEEALNALSAAQAAQTGAETARAGAEEALNGAQTAQAGAETEAKSALEQAERAKWEADRAQAVAGGDFVTDLELDLAVADQAATPLVGPAELAGELLPGGVLFITDEALPEDYAVTLEDLLAEGDKAAAGEEDDLETLLTVGVAKALGLRADGEGSLYTLATLPSLAVDIRALCGLAQAGGAYVLDGRTAVSHRQVQYYILHKTLVTHAKASMENWGWMGDVRTEIQALRVELSQLRGQVGDVMVTLDEVMRGGSGDE